MTQETRPPRRTPASAIRDTIREAACMIGLSLVVVIILIFLAVGRLFHDADDTDWADLAT